MKSIFESRRIVHVEGTEPGPVALCTAAVHGNEPAGVEASLRAAEKLSRLSGAFKGSFVVLIGNSPALEVKQRYLEADLNRLWMAEQVSKLRTAPEQYKQISSEHRQQVELFEALDELSGAASGDVFFIDLHSTSSESIPFVVCLGDSAGLELSRYFPIPTVSAATDKISGSLIEFMTNHSTGAITIEGGKHNSAETVDRIEAALWVFLCSIGNLDSSQVDTYQDYYDTLAVSAAEYNRNFEEFYHHRVSEGDGFSMTEQLLNFQQVSAGQVVAKDNSGSIAVPHDGLIFLPTYELPCDYGFFLIREAD